MTPLLIAALVAILSHQPDLNISVIDGPVTEIHQVRGGVVRSPGAYGWVECTNGYVDRLVHNGNPGTFLHEALHGADCVDDGRVNGSLLPYPPTEVDAAHEWVGWCFVNQQECIERMEKVR